MGIIRRLFIFHRKTEIICLVIRIAIFQNTAIVCCENGTDNLRCMYLVGRERMPKYIDKMNLPQYKYFNDILRQDEGRKQLISTAMTGVHMVKIEAEENGVKVS